MNTALAWAAAGTGFTFLMTALGASLVFFFRRKMSVNVQRAFLGFAAGVMTAAAVWSLLIPAMEEAESAGLPGWIPGAGGFLLGVGFLLLLDVIIPHLHPDALKPEGPHAPLRRSTLMVLAVTLHNIPEGMAVGVAFAGLMAEEGAAITLAGALALSLGIAIQNFPEGAIISLPLKEAVGKKKAFLYGMLSGIVEPIGAACMILLSDYLGPFLPYFLALAAGAMLYVVVEELIPESAEGEHSNVGTIGFALGFVVMMILDVALG